MCNNVLNLFAISQFSVISFWPSLKNGLKLFFGRGFRYYFIYGFPCVPDIGFISTKSRLIVHIFRCTYVFLVW